MTILLVLLIGSILLLNLLVFRTLKYIILVTNMISNLRENYKNEYEDIVQGYNLKHSQVILKSKVKGSNVVYFNAHCKNLGWKE